MFFTKKGKNEVFAIATINGSLYIAHEQAGARAELSSCDYIPLWTDGQPRTIHLYIHQKVQTKPIPPLELINISGIERKQRYPYSYKLRNNQSIEASHPSPIEALFITDTLELRRQRISRERHHGKFELLG